ncbi:hypothetical protein [Mesorhizobium sp. CN2-181]|uniref:hypothetical protein n=1 Tax=Mesorhizobium yinganensis TaxID=3157707 RepID=UPI0032B72FC7
MKKVWNRIRRWFKDSEVIALARLQMLLGILMAALLEVDPQIFSFIIPAKYLGLYFFLFGILLEFLRTIRDDKMKNDR